ncbi:TetR/AcrR family transcriptional regulator [Aneurinibacillus sp. REN35]|uniref:TetR/AcrR family transcriptional regulator n=1 Tax=Aneurinibacillus sp. REN35 TaxID=3237286 RepID=UPI003527DEB7
MAPKSDEQYKKIRDKRYEELSNAALKIFSSKGFAATKISDITSSVNLSHGLFYHYFQSKEDIYISLIMNVLDMFTEAVNDIERRDGTPWEKLTWLTERTFSASLEEGLYRHILVIQAFQSESIPLEIKKAMSEKYQAAMQGISRIIAAGQRDGVFVEDDPMELAIYYLSLSHGLTLWNVKGFAPITVSVEKVMRHLKA